MIDPIAFSRELAREIGSRAAAADRTGRLPVADAELLRRSGFTSLSFLPVGESRAGRTGLSLRDCLLAQLEIAKASTSTALVAGMSMHTLGHERDTRQWPAEIHEELLTAALGKEGILINSVASEPRLGSPSRGGPFQTTARPSEDGRAWIINGHKNWITGGRHLTHMLVKLSLGDGSGTILVPADTPGLRWEETWGDALSLRASDSDDLFFEEARVPHRYLLTPPAGDPPPNVWFPLVMAATYLGGGLGARDAAIRYALERVPTALGKPIASLPKIQRQIGEIDAVLRAAQAFLLETAGRYTGRETAAERRKLLPTFAAAKQVATDAANRATEQALQIAGGASISKDLPLERFFRDVRAGAMHPPSGDTAYELIGRAAIEEIEPL